MDVSDALLCDWACWGWGVAGQGVRHVPSCVNLEIHKGKLEGEEETNCTFHIILLK